MPFNYDGGDGYVTKSSSQQTTWIASGNGLWDAGANWSIGAAPGYFNDVIINPLLGAVVTGPAASTNVRSITVDAVAGGTTTALNLSGIATITVSTTVQVNGRGQVNLSAGSLITPQLNVIGSFVTSGGSSLRTAGVSNSGTMSIGSAAALGTIDGTGTFNVSSGGTITATYIRQNSVTINGSAAISPRAGSESPSMVGTLSFGGSAGHWTGLLDLANNDLILSNMPLTMAVSYATSVANHSGGIISSNALADTTNLTTLGIILNQDAAGHTLYGSSTSLGAFDGQSPAATAVLLKYTYYGDSNLDGKVDGSDYSRIDNGYLSHSTGWYNGDFNYDGSVNGSDYTLIDNAFNTQGAALTASALVAVETSQLADGAPVPEPTIAIAEITAAAALLRRRTRRTAI